MIYMIDHYFHKLIPVIIYNQFLFLKVKKLIEKEFLLKQIDK